MLFLSGYYQSLAVDSDSAAGNHDPAGHVANYPDAAGYQDGAGHAAGYQDAAGHAAGYQDAAVYQDSARHVAGNAAGHAAAYQLLVMLMGIMTLLALLLVSGC